MDLGRNQYVVSLELGIFQGRPKSIRPNFETVKIRPMAQEADSTHFFRPISVHLKWTDSVQMRVTKARRSFYSLKRKIPWQTPSEKKFNLYFSQVLFALLYGIPSWSPDITRLKIMENFQKQCFKWIFGTKTSYQQLLKNHSILPICHLIELRTLIFLTQLMNNKYQYDYRKFLVVTDSTNQRRICSFNFFKTNTLSSNLNSFFTRSAIIANGWL